MLEAIKIRRTVRKFNTQPVEEDKILEVIKAGMQAPSSKDSRPWEFVIIDNREILDALAKTHHGAKQLKTAQACIVVLGDNRKFYKAGRWILDLSACMENMLLEIVNQKLCGSWVGCFPSNKRVAYVSELLNLPKHMVAYSMIAVGYSDIEKNEFIDKFDGDKIHKNTYI